MTMHALIQRPWQRWSVCAALALSVLGGLTACSTAPSPYDDVGAQVSPSEETDIRRRARIRLELASNYFANGQMDVALDEVKQSMAIDPSFGAAYNLRGLIHMGRNELAMADHYFDRSLALQRGDPDTLHNQGWLYCLQERYEEAQARFNQALDNPRYQSSVRTLMAQGMCYYRAGALEQAEQTLKRAYELDAANPLVGYNIAELLLRRQEFERARFYARRLNNSEWANAESLWLGIRIERALGDTVAVRQLSEQLRKRFPQSKELLKLERGAFDE